MNGDADLAMIDIQSLVSQRQEAVQEATQILQSESDATQSVINNIGDGGGSNGNGSSGDGTSSSDGDHHQAGRSLRTPTTRILPVRPRRN